MQRHPEYTRDRVRQLADRIRERIYSETRSIDTLQVAGPVDRISYEQAQQLKEFRATRLGEQFSPLWSTFWFRASVTIPKEWAGKRVDLLWESHSEATLWMDGKAVQGLNYNPRSWDGSTRPDAILLNAAKGGERVDFQIEMACNKLFGVDEHNTGGMFKQISPYVLDRADVGVFDPIAWEIFWDLIVLVELEAEQAREPRDLDKSYAGFLLAELNRFANTFDESDRATWSRAHLILKKLYENRNATVTHELSAIGHAHIDTAWLWPIAETHRKCERTFSTQTTYMREYPEYKFACSQAYQYQVIKDRNPELFARIKSYIEKGQWVPVGGTWIEPDCNIPSGESLARQFLHGQRFFQQHFGFRCREFWNPDVFGYNGQLPQICQLSGINRFLTQKLSWNAFNKPHHHTFTWEGIDGSEVFTHFPPADTYNAVLTVQELRRGARNYKDHDRSRHALTLFGFGDGGGGPTKPMLERLRRARDLQGLPRTTSRSSDEFFDLLEKDCTDRIRIVGELYFEFHRGTYTSQAQTKRMNRRCEQLLHDLEFLSVIAQRTQSRSDKFQYPADELDRLWKIVLLNQFHDILPGSSITQVYDDAARMYADVESAGMAHRRRALEGIEHALNAAPSPAGKPAVINTLGFARRQVMRFADGELRMVDAPSYGIGFATDAADRVQISESADRIVLENAHLRATLSRAGHLVSLVEKFTRRETMAGAGNQFELYEDKPRSWDAWDIDPFALETLKPVAPATSCSVLSQSPLRCEVEFSYRISGLSTMRQVVRLDADARRLEFHCDVDWNEKSRLLKVAFPVNVRAMNATYEMQFGVAERPTHYNTMYDLARFEVPGHRFVDLSEHGFGVAMLSESKYGYSVFGNTMRMSLLRAPNHPDPTADRGRHQFAFAIMPHAGAWQQSRVVREAMSFNCPLVELPAMNVSPMSFFECDDENIVLDTIKRAEDSDAIVLRMYECHGGRGTARVRINLPFTEARYCNILEDEIAPAQVRDGVIDVPYAPFKVISLLVR